MSILLKNEEYIFSCRLGTAPYGSPPFGSAFSSFPHHHLAELRRDQTGEYSHELFHLVRRGCFAVQPDGKRDPVLVRHDVIGLGISARAGHTQYYPVGGGLGHVVMHFVRHRELSSTSASSAHSVSRSRGLGRP